MTMICEKCRKETAADAGAFIYYQGKMLFACKACENKINDEIKCGNKVSAAVDGKKVQAVYITENKDWYNWKTGTAQLDCPLFYCVGTSYPWQSCCTW